VLRPQILSLFERLDAHPSYTGRGVTMAFVDVGFYPHPDLTQPQRRIKAYADVGRARPVPENFLQPRPSSWHGTMTACVAAGNGYVSGGRFRGLACDADVVLIRAAGSGGEISGENVASALRFPLRHPDLGVRVVSVSLGVNNDDPNCADVERAIDELNDAGVVVVAAAGNDPSSEPEVPGSAAGAISVGGSNDQNSRRDGDDLSWPSSYRRSGLQKPDLIAPAILLPAPMLPGTMTAREARPLFDLVALLEEVETECSFDQKREVSSSMTALQDAVFRRIEAKKYISPDYQHVDGTSFATPITASVVAQMLEANPRLTPHEIKRGLLQTATLIDGVPERQQGAGVLRPRQAVEWALAKAGRGKGA
jgi:serine protease AprX